MQQSSGEQSASGAAAGAAAAGAGQQASSYDLSSYQQDNSYFPGQDYSQHYGSNTNAAGGGYGGNTGTLSQNQSETRRYLEAKITTI